MNVFQRLKATLRLREAVKKATEAYEKTGDRFYVMPASQNNCKLLIMNRYNFRKFKQKGYISRKASVRDMEIESFYFTPYRNGSGEINPIVIDLKRNQYMEWYNNCLKEQKRKRKEKRKCKKEKKNKTSTES